MPEPPCPWLTQQMSFWKALRVAFCFRNMYSLTCNPEIIYVQGHFSKTFQNYLGVWRHSQPIIKGLMAPNTGKCVLCHSYPMPSSSKPLENYRILNDASKALRDGGPFELRRCQSGERDGARQGSQDVVEGSVRALSLVDERTESTGA